MTHREWRRSTQYSRSRRYPRARAGIAGGMTTERGSSLEAVAGGWSGALCRAATSTRCCLCASAPSDVAAAGDRPAEAVDEHWGGVGQAMCQMYAGRRAVDIVASHLIQGSGMFTGCVRARACSKRGSILHPAGPRWQRSSPPPPVMAMSALRVRGWFLKAMPIRGITGAIRIGQTLVWRTGGREGVRMASTRWDRAPLAARCSRTVLNLWNETRLAPVQPPAGLTASSSIQPSRCAPPLASSTPPSCAAAPRCAPTTCLPRVPLPRACDRPLALLLLEVEVRWRSSARVLIYYLKAAQEEVPVERTAWVRRMQAGSSAAGRRQPAPGGPACS